MKFCNNLLFILFVSLSQFSYGATSYHGDSVMSPGVYSSAPMVLSNQNVSSGNQYTSASVMEYQTAICPSGMTTISGSSIYNSAQRTITTTYLGSQVVGTTTSAWSDTDTDCISYQYQTIACPTNYTGSISQQQEVSTGTGGIVYGGWVTTANSCVYNPPIVYKNFRCQRSNGQGNYFADFYLSNALGDSFDLSTYYSHFGNVGTPLNSTVASYNIVQQVQSGWTGFSCYPI